MDGRTSGRVNGRSVFTSLVWLVQWGQHPEHRLLLMCWMRTAVQRCCSPKSPQRPSWRSGLRLGQLFGRSLGGGGCLSRMREWRGDPGKRRGLCQRGVLSIGCSPAAWPSPECSAGAAGWRWRSPRRYSCCAGCFARLLSRCWCSIPGHPAWNPSPPHPHPGPLLKQGNVECIVKTLFRTDTLKPWHIRGWDVRYFIVS